MKNKVLERMKAGLVVSGAVAGNKSLIIRQKYCKRIEKNFFRQVIHELFFLKNASGDEKKTTTKLI